MMPVRATLLLGVLCVKTLAAAQPRDFVVNTITCDSSTSFPFLLQFDRDPAPEWAVLTPGGVLVTDLVPGTQEIAVVLPSGTTLFDLRDADRDGIPDLAVVRESRLDYWPDARNAATSEPALSIEDSRFVALAYGSPRPARLFFRQRGDVYLSAPFFGEPRIWDLAGEPVPLDADERPPAPELIFLQTWEASPSPASPAGSREFQITQRFESTGAETSSMPDIPPSARSARDAAEAPVAEWPSFSLERVPSGTDRAAFAFAPPEHRDTLISILPGTPDARSNASPKLFPGLLIVAGGRSPDLNGDGFADLALWRPTRSAPTLDALSVAAATGAFEVLVTVHLFERDTGRYTGRPTLWFKADAPLLSALGAGAQGPFAHVLFEDIDRDGTDELITTGKGDEVVAWTFGGSPGSGPKYRTSFDEPVIDFVYSDTLSEDQWLLIASTPNAFHLLTLPKD